MVIQTCMNINTSPHPPIFTPGSLQPHRARTVKWLSHVHLNQILDLVSFQNQDFKTRRPGSMKGMRQKLLSLRHKKSRVHTRSSRLFQLFRWTRYLNQLHVTDLMLKGHHGHTLTDITDSFFLVKYVQPSKKWPIISRIQVRRREFISSLDIPLEHVLLRTNDRPREIFYLARSDLNIARAISTLWN